MKFYVATGFERKEHQRALTKKLTEAGHSITFDWTKYEESPYMNDEIRSKISEEELAGVVNSDFVAVLLPGGRGTHAELGMALAAKKPVFLHAPDGLRDKDGKDCIFYLHPTVKVFRGPEEQFSEFITSQL